MSRYVFNYLGLNIYIKNEALIAVFLRFCIYTIIKLIVNGLSGLRVFALLHVELENKIKRALSKSRRPMEGIALESLVRFHLVS